MLFMFVMVVCVFAWSGVVFIAIALDKTSSLVIGAEPLGGATAASANNVLCLLTFA